MRTFLLAIFWITNLGSVIQLLIMASGCWIVFSGAYSFTDLNVYVFVTQYVPWLLWVKTFIVEFLGDFGIWILTIPILIIAPLKVDRNDYIWPNSEQNSIMNYIQGSSAKCLRFQPVDATHWLNRSAGVSKFNVSLGLSLSRLATWYFIAFLRSIRFWHC